MPNELNYKDIREAVEFFFHEHSIDGMTVNGKHSQVLYNLATAYLNVDGLPEKKKSITHDFGQCCSHSRINAWNECLYLCKVGIARDYIKRDFNELVNALEDDFGEHIEIKMKDIIEMENPKGEQDEEKN